MDVFTIERNLTKSADFPLERQFKIEKLENYDYGNDENSTKKFRNMKIKGLGIPPVSYSD